MIPTGLQNALGMGQSEGMGGLGKPQSGAGDVLPGVLPNATGGNTGLFESVQRGGASKRRRGKKSRKTYRKSAKKSYRKRNRKSARK